MQRDTKSFIFNSVSAFVPILFFLIVYSLFPYLRCSFRVKDVFPVTFQVLPKMDKLFVGHVVRQLITYHRDGVLAFMAVVPYILHFFLPWTFVLVLLLTHRTMDAITFGNMLCLSSILMLSIQLLFSTAPPWAVSTNITSLDVQNIECNGLSGTSVPDLTIKYKYAAQFSYFYKTFGFSLISDIFALNKAAFCAFPSMHIGWVMCVIMCGGWHASFPWIGYTHLAWLSWAVIYSDHHYFVDILGAVLIVLFTFSIKNRFFKPSKLSAFYIPSYRLMGDV